MAICLSAAVSVGALPASVYLAVSAGAYPLSGSACLQKIGPYRIEHQGWWASSYAGAMPKRQGDAR